MNTKNVINWFSQQTQKSNVSFLTLDIIDFYPFTSDELKNKSIELAKEHSAIDDTECETIMHARRNLLYDNIGNMWNKK